MAMKSTEERVFDILKDTNIKYPYEKVLIFFRFYTQTGNILRSANEAEVNYDVSRYWLSTAYADKIIRILKVEQNKVLDVKMTGLIETVIGAIEERLEYGDWNTRGDRVPVQIDKLLKALTTLYDKRALIRGEPTSRVERVSTEDRLRRLGKRFESLPKKAQEFILENIDEEQDQEEVTH